MKKKLGGVEDILPNLYLRCSATSQIKILTKTKRGDIMKLESGQRRKYAIHNYSERN